jgi:catechol 2,3-dioxygenase-like lactoylglutathione lyase family enzyme
MLADHDATATIAVRDLKAARKFYENTLGLQATHTEGDEAVEYQSGHSKVLVYKSQYAGTNKATAATWSVDDVDDAVRELKGKGVTFEHYDLPDTTRQGDVHVSGTLKVAWFKDPDGNILSLTSD